MCSCATSGFTPTIFRMVKGWNEREVMPSSGHVYVSSGFVWLGFQCKLETVASRDVIFAQIVHSLAQALYGLICTAAGVRFHAIAPEPQNENLRAQFRADIHGPHGLLEGMSSHFRVVRGESAIPENRMKKERYGRHWDGNATVFACPLEVPHKAISFGRRCVDRHQIVIVQIYAPCTDVGEQAHQLRWRKLRANRIAKMVAASIADCPESKRELVLRTGLIQTAIISHRQFLRFRISNHISLKENGSHRRIDAPILS